MQFLDGRLIVSPSDLTGFLECEHLTQQELAAARGEIERPERDDPMLDMLSRRGSNTRAGTWPTSRRGAWKPRSSESLSCLRQSIVESVFVRSSTTRRLATGGHVLKLPPDSVMAQPRQPTYGTR